MAWTKTKITVTAAAILALAATGMAVDKVIEAHHATDLGIWSFEIGPDGFVRYRERVEFVNTYGTTIPANNPMTTLDWSDIEQWTDGTGQDIKYTKVPGSYGDGRDTNWIKYIFSYNRPIPPGGKFTTIIRGKIDGRRFTWDGQPLIQPTGTPGEFLLTDHENCDVPAATFYEKSIWRLPAGSVLVNIQPLENVQPADLMVVTNQGQVEVHFDAMLPHTPKTDVWSIRYRLASAAQ